MLLVLIFSLFTFCLATPFHKYPFVFLLDVGNEELGKANTEQIKVSVPGGVLALKYPAMSDGQIIGHVRVTGIDFGTDLKATIEEGGPGYRYVVIVLTGAPGKQYDTVITMQTLDEGISGDYKVQEDTEDDNAEGSNDSVSDQGMSAKITNSDSFTYEQNEVSIDKNEDIKSSDDNEDNLNNADNDDISQLSLFSDVYRRNNEETEQRDSDIIKSDTNQNVLYANEVGNTQQENIGQQEVAVQPIDEKFFSNAARTYVSVIPLNVLAGYGRLPGFYGNIMSYPQSAITQDKGLTSEKDNKSINNNIDDYISAVDY